MHGSTFTTVCTSVRFYVHTQSSFNGQRISHCLSDMFPCFLYALCIVCELMCIVFKMYMTSTVHVCMHGCGHGVVQCACDVHT